MSLSIEITDGPDILRCKNDMGVSRLCYTTTQVEESRAIPLCQIPYWWHRLELNHDVHEFNVNNNGMLPPAWVLS